MKTFFRNLIAALLVPSLAIGAANDMQLVQRNSGNTANVPRALAPVANGVWGWNGSFVPISYNTTGTGNVVMSASPTLTGTAGFASLTASGTINSLKLNLTNGQAFLAGMTADWDGMTGTDNSPVIQAALDAGAKYIVIGAGEYAIDSTINVPPGVTITGVGDVATVLHYTGVAYAFENYADSSADLLKDSRILNMTIYGPDSAGLIDVSDIYRMEVSNVALRDTPGNAIRLINNVDWTEGFRSYGVMVRDAGTAVKMEVDGGTNSFAELNIHDMSIVMTTVGSVAFDLDADGYVYGHNMNGKINVEVPAASTPTDTKSILVKLGDAAVWEDGKFEFLQELGQDRNFFRLQLGFNARFGGYGYLVADPSTAMSMNLDATHTFDDTETSSVYYISPAGQLLPRNGIYDNVIRLGAGNATVARKTSVTDTTTPVLYVSSGLVELNLKYTGTSRNHSLSLLVDASTAGTTPKVTVLSNRVQGTVVFDPTDLPRISLSTVNSNAFLYATLINTVGDGVLTATATLKSFETTGGTSDFGTQKPFVLFPDMTGISVGSVVSLAQQPVTITGNATATANQTIIGNGTVFEKLTLAAGDNISFTKNSTTLTINATGGGGGGGNVTGSSLTANAVVVGAGSSAISVLASLGNSGAPLLSAGAGAPPAFGALNLAGGSNIVTGITPVANGGTGANTLTANSVITGNGTGAVTFVAPGTSGNVLTSNGTAWLSQPSAGGMGGNYTVTGNVVASSGNVTINSGTNFDIVLDPGGTGVTSIVGAGNTTGNFTVGDSLVVTNNATFGNLTTTNLTISGAITGTIGVTNGGTGRATGTTAYSLIATGTTATGAQQTLASGATTEILVGGGASALPVWTTATGSGAPVRATSPTLTTPNLGTPSAVVLTSGTGLPISTGVSGLGTSVATALAINVGSAGSVVTSNATQTLTAKKVQASGALGADDTYDATFEVAGQNAGATIAQWEAVYLDGSSTWQLADANGSGTFPAVGLAVAAYSSTNPAVVVIQGTVRNDAWAWTPGGVIYLSATPGGLTQTAPSTSGDKVQQIGRALTADIILLNVNNEYLTVQ